MWYFTIYCTVSYIACGWPFDVTNTYMYAETEVGCYQKAQSLAAMERLPADKWAIRCEQAAIAKAPSK
jgi:hypothetical protein